MFNRRHLLASATALAATTAAGLSASRATAAGAATTLNSAFDSIFQDILKLSPETCTSLGLDTGALAAQKSKLDGDSPADRQAQVTHLRNAKKRLAAIDRKALSGMDRINYDTVLWDTDNSLKGAEAFNYGSVGGASPYVLSQLGGSYQSVPDFLDSQHSIETRADAEAYLSRLEAFATVLDQETAQFKRDTAAGVVPPDFVIDQTVKQLKALQAQNTLVSSITGRTRDKGINGDWQARAEKIVAGKVSPALTRQIDAVAARRAGAVHDAGVWRLPQGEAYYTYAARCGTSTDMTPDEIHQLGLDKVAEISGQIDALLKTQGMSQGTPGERMRALYTDPKQLYPNTDAGKAQLLSDLNGMVDAVYAKLPDWFGVQPKSKVTIKRIPQATEAGAPGGYYTGASLDGSRPGAYYINLRDTAENPRFLLPTLTHHEAVPGHHLQISIQQEAQGLPMLRKISGFTAYIEGWALYAEQLADEMGLYADDPFGKVGYLHDALFRAVRLVVDTGMHHKRWTREQAVAYMVKYTGDAESADATEIERYCVWPGQALGYMVGKLTWLKIRAASQTKLGNAFSIKTFHDTGLLCGAVPLAVLQQVYAEKGAI